jgi:hypothetical protein
MGEYIIQDEIKEGEKFITIAEMSNQLGIHRNNLVQYGRKNGFVFQKIRTPESKNLLTLALTKGEFEELKQLRRKVGFTSKQVSRDHYGEFYIIQPIPEVSENRIKMGFTTNIRARMKIHSASCPYLKVLTTFPCKREWEGAVIDILSDGEKKLGFEVIEVGSIEKLLEKAKQVFKIFPDLTTPDYEMV